LKRGKSFRIESLVLKRLFEKESKKFGFLISKKFFKKAVERNKLKRRLREMLREKIEKIREGARIIFIALPGFEKKGLQELKEVLERLLKISKVLK
jgi:ribonuclease P protein component